MERARPIPRERDWKDPRERDRRGLAAIMGGLLTGAVLLTGCDSVSGIPGDEPKQTSTPTASTKSAAIATTTPTDVARAFAVPVGAVPGLPGATDVAARFGAVLAGSTPAELRAKCWMLAPGNVADMATEQTAILKALAQPATTTQNTVTWQNAGTSVTFDRNEVVAATKNSSQIVCPWVAQDGEAGPNEADARHTVRRYLSRFVGTPLDPSDKEGTYPLVCKASPANWDPNGTGSPTAPPLANNPGKLTGTTKFTDQEIRSERLRADYVTVQVPVTNSSGVTQTHTFTLTADAEGYCIGDVSA
ncbi:hypothetical protein [Nocardia sp. NPDC050412]|uniref:hypothetical protein n=1 Tax=unclassified Nocardia TaxID=2637762 RepID=UPI00379FFD23